MTMNQQPLHLDGEFGRHRVRRAAGQRPLHDEPGRGCFDPGRPTETIVANLSYDDVEHPNPVFHGDTIRAQSTVTDKHETSDGERGIVTMHVEAFKANDPDEPLVCEFDRTVLSLKRERAADDGEDAR